MSDGPRFCAVCGRELGPQHGGCPDPLEPPRYCARCRRRMVVQVLPTGWRARCVEHGELLDGSPSRHAR